MNTRYPHSKSNAVPQAMSAGFSLLELLVVLMIMSIVMAVAAPRLAPQVSASRLKAGTMEFNAMVHLARFRAAEAGRTCRLVLYPRQKILELLSADKGQAVIRRRLPEGLRIYWVEREGRLDRADAITLNFAPDGSAAQTRIKIGTADGSAWILRCKAAGGSIDVE